VPTPPSESNEGIDEGSVNNNNNNNSNSNNNNAKAKKIKSNKNQEVHVLRCDTQEILVSLFLYRFIKYFCYFKFYFIILRSLLCELFFFFFFFFFFLFLFFK